MQVSRYVREFGALPAQELPARLKDLAEEWAGLVLSLFDKTPQVPEETLVITGPNSDKGSSLLV